jgi:hypothetical protein
MPANRILVDLDSFLDANAALCRSIDPAAFSDWVVKDKYRERYSNEFWKRTNKWGALAGMVCGGSMVFIWKYLIRPLGGIWNIYELLPAFLIACAAIVIVSLLTPKPSKEIEEEFDRVAQMK